MAIVWRPLDHGAEVDVSFRSMPHWDQAGALTFVTMRLADSMPQEVLDRWQREQRDWLARNGLAGTPIAIALVAGVIPPGVRRDFFRYRTQRWHAYLDDCHGRCELREPRFAQQVADSLLKFHGERYDLERFVVMPNHVHLMVQMREEHQLRKQCQGWMRYSARQINGQLGRSGAFWQCEPFDHVVRNDRQFEYLQHYIQNNPIKAGLRPTEFRFWKYEP